MMRLSDLDADERLLVWAARRWTRDFRTGTGGGSETIRAVAGARLGRDRGEVLADALAEAVGLMARHGDPDLLPPGCPLVSCDEARLLALVALRRNAARGRARMTARLLAGRGHDAALDAAAGQIAGALAAD